MLRRASALLIVCVALPARRHKYTGPIRRSVTTHSGHPYGPRFRAPWSYYGLEGLPYVTYP